jgi:hypothetical protein
VIKILHGEMEKGLLCKIAWGEANLAITCIFKEVPIPWVLKTVRNKEEPGFWGYCVWRVDNQRVRSPCGLIASTQECLSIKRK